MKASAVGLLMLAAAPAAAQTGGDACPPPSHANAVLVRVHGFEALRGTVRVQLNGDAPGSWLEKNRWLSRTEVPVRSNQLLVCVPIAKPGKYAIAIRHDVDGDRKMTSKDGGGYSRNPALSIMHLRPSFDEVAFDAHAGVTRIDVVMNYLHGLSIRPGA